MNSMEYDETDQYQEILNQLRKRLSDLITPDHTDDVLLRWLRAKNFNLTEAEENFRGNNESRKLYGINTIVDWYIMPEVLEKYEGATFLGFAKDGSGVRYIRADEDYYGFIHSVSFSDLNLYFCYLIEKDLRATRNENNRTGLKTNQIIYILDVQRYSIYQLTHRCVVETGVECIRLLQDHFPEIWKYVIFVNVPPVFNRLYNLFKPMLRDGLVKKFKNATKENTKELLRTFIDDDVLPAFLGGQRVDSKGDPYCKEFIKQAGKIPETYYLKNCLHFIDMADPDVNMKIISAGRVFNLPLLVKEAGTRIRFEVRTENGFIDLTFLLRDFDENLENPEFPLTDEYLDPHDDASNVEVVGVRIRLQCHLAPCDAIATASKPCIYIMQFGNTSSWFISRKLFYRVTLLPPENSSK